MVRSVAGNLPEQVKNNQSVNTAAGNGGQKMSQYSWFTVYIRNTEKSKIKKPAITADLFTYLFLAVILIRLMANMKIQAPITSRINFTIIPG